MKVASDIMSIPDTSIPEQSNAALSTLGKSTLSLFARRHINGAVMTRCQRLVVPTQRAREEQSQNGK